MTKIDLKSKALKRLEKYKEKNEKLQAYSQVEREKYQRAF